jgi:hypothetical protein
VFFLSPLHSTKPTNPRTQIYPNAITLMEPINHHSAASAIRSVVF